MPFSWKIFGASSTASSASTSSSSTSSSSSRLSIRKVFQRNRRRFFSRSAATQQRLNRTQTEQVIKPIPICFNILVVGDQMAGKTAIVNKIKRNNLLDKTSALDCLVNESRSRCEKSKVNLKFQIWDYCDIGKGSKSKLKIDQFNAIVVAIDAYNFASHYSIFKWLYFVIEKGNVACQTMVLLNKIDLLGIRYPNPVRGTTLHMIEQACHQHKISVYPISAQTGDNIDNAVRCLMGDIVKRQLCVDSNQLTFHF